MNINLENNIMESVNDILELSNLIEISNTTSISDSNSKSIYESCSIKSDVESDDELCYDSDTNSTSTNESDSDSTSCISSDDHLGEIEHILDLYNNYNADLITITDVKEIIQDLSHQSNSIENSELVVPIKILKCDTIPTNLTLYIDSEKDAINSEKDAIDSEKDAIDSEKDALSFMMEIIHGYKV